MTRSEVFEGSLDVTSRIDTNKLVVPGKTNLLVMSGVALDYQFLMV